MQKKRKQSKTKKTPAEKPDSIQPKKRTKLTPEKVTLLVYNYLNSNCNKTQALEKTGYSRTYARSKGQLVFQMLRVKNELAKQIKPIQAQVQVNIMQIQSALIRIAEKCENTEEYPAAISAYNSILKTIGGFQADRIPDNNLLGKALDAKTAEAINAILNAHYNHKYLAVPVENEVKGQSQTERVSEATETPGGSDKGSTSTDKGSTSTEFDKGSTSTEFDTEYSAPQSGNCSHLKPRETNDKPTVKVTASHPVSSTITGRTGQAAGVDIIEPTPITPQATPASPLHSPLLTCDGFSEKVVVGNEER